MPWTCSSCHGASETVVPAQRFPRTVAVAPIWHDLVVMLLGEGEDDDAEGARFAAKSAIDTGGQIDSEDRASWVSPVTKFRRLHGISEHPRSIVAYGRRPERSR